MNYSEFLSHLGKMVTFEGDNQGDASIGTLLSVLRMAESRIYRELRTRQNEKAFSGSVSGNAYTLPSDFRAPSLTYFGGKPLEPVSPEFLYEHLDAQHTGDTRFFAAVGNTYKFAPVVADGTSVQGTYFYAYPDIDASNDAANLLFTANPDLFTFACMVEAAPLYGFLDQLQLWEQKYQMTRDALNHQTSRAAYGAGRIKRRNSTRLIG